MKRRERSPPKSDAQEMKERASWKKGEKSCEKRREE